MHVESIHRREIAGTLEDVFDRIAALGTKDDVIWPSPRMPFVRTPGPMRVGVTRERHGVIRAVLDGFEDGRSVVWRAELPFLAGTHAFDVRPSPGGRVVVTHTLDAELAWWFAPVWRLRMGALHDRIVGALLERLSRSVAG